MLLFTVVVLFVTGYFDYLPESARHPRSTSLPFSNSPINYKPKL